MKKNRLIVLAFAISLLSLVSCKKSDSQNNTNSNDISTSKTDSEKKNRGTSAGYEGIPFNSESYSEEAPEYKERNALHLGTNSSNLVNFDSVKQFFTLYYTP